MQEINLRQSFVAQITTTPQLILASREAGDNRAYLKLFNKDPANTVMFSPDIEYEAASFSTAGSGIPVAPGVEYWDQPGSVPSNAFYAWTLSGTAALSVWEG
jgi:hypothetical protein